MFKTRLISGVLLVIVALAFILLGGNILLFGLCVISLVGLYELYQIIGIEKKSLGILGYLAVIVYYSSLYVQFLEDIMIFTLLFLIVLMAAYVAAYPKYKIDAPAIVFLGVFYVAVMLSCIYKTRMLIGGEYLVWLIFLCSWGSDTCAYCVGVLFGKHKMAPKLSPKKSIEGAVGGVVGTMLLTFVYGYLFYEQMNMKSTQVFVLAIISGVGAIISMIGDLAASAIKRNYQIKDFGTIIPGHGGILDRFDSVIFTAPVILYFAYYFVS